MNTEIQHSILLVEDDLRLADLVSRYLVNHGFIVAVVSRGDEVVERVQRDNPDLVILDLGLPGEDGFSICRRLRPEYANPILILTARDNDIDHVLGLELGADDYVIKPVEPRVLLARIGVLLRRNRPAPAPGASKVLTFGRLLINIVSRAVKWDGREVALSRNEFDLLVFLASHPGEIQSRERLFKSLYNRDYDGLDRMLDIRISRLRRKLDDDAENPQRIKTIWGQGYLFVPDAW
ncbi:MAG: winged helix-turn-helix domain-containing protein [Proteobacteria bacterium]|nr:winged helix-turn-helix domain-containing protein [Pseudomonadota bacterium]